MNMPKVKQQVVLVGSRVYLLRPPVTHSLNEKAGWIPAFTCSQGQEPCLRKSNEQLNAMTL